MGKILNTIYGPTIPRCTKGMILSKSPWFQKTLLLSFSISNSTMIHGSKNCSQAWLFCSQILAIPISFCSTFPILMTILKSNSIFFIFQYRTNRERLQSCIKCALVWFQLLSFSNFPLSSTSFHIYDQIYEEVKWRVYKRKNNFK